MAHTPSKAEVDRVEELIQQAPADERGAKLVSLCRGDSALRQAVEQRLLADAPTATHVSPQAPTDAAPHGAVQRFTGQTLDGRYVVGRHIADGGMGSVYEATQIETGQQVAIKFPKARFDSGANAEQFVQEIRTMAALKHDNIARVYDAGEFNDPEGRPRRYLVMELVEGARTLRKYVTQENLSTARRLHLFLELCQAVHFIHQHQSLHRDLKPSNVLVDSSGRVKVTDFGLANSGGGTIPYMSPEQEESSADIDERTDIYALGVILRELITGQRPTSDTADGAKLGGELGAIASDACATNREDRPETVEKLAQQIRRFIDKRAYQRVLARHWGAAKVVGVILAITLSAVLIRTVVGVSIVRMEAAHGAYWSLLQQVAPAPADSALAQLDHVRVIAMRDTDRLVELAHELGLEEVSADNKKSFRLLHAALNRKLIGAQPRVVVWDIQFKSETDFDEKLAASIRELRESGVGVALIMFGWGVDESSAPRLSPTIWQAGPLWGSSEIYPSSAVGDDSDGNYWRPLALFRAGKPALPSIVLTAFALSQSPEDFFEVSFDPGSQEITLRFWLPALGRPDVRTMRKYERVLSPGAFRSAAEIAYSPSLFRPSEVSDVDHFALNLVEMAPESALDEIELDYSDVLNMPTADLAQRIADKVVVVGDMRSRLVDHHTFAGRQNVPGAHIVACDIEALIRDYGKRTLPPNLERLSLVFASLAGALAAVIAFLCLHRQLRHGPVNANRIGSVILLNWAKTIKLRWPLIAVLMAASVICSIVAYVYADALLSPIFIIGAVFLGSELGAVVLSAPRVVSIFTSSEIGIET